MGGLQNLQGKRVSGLPVSGESYAASAGCQTQIGVPHPCPSCPPSQGTCTEGPHGRSSEDPGNWGSQRGGRSWGRWCSSGARHSSHLQACMDRAAGPGHGALQPSQRRRAAVRGRGGAGSGTLSTPPRRPCAGGHICR